MQRGCPGDWPERIVRRNSDPAVSARAAIFFVSNRPPVWQMSGWAMWMARAARMRELAPPDQAFAGGDGHRDLAAMCASPAVSPGGTGSSANMIRAGSIALR